MKKVLITGVNGFVGQHIVRKLSEYPQDFLLFGLDIKPAFEPYDFNTGGKVEYHSINLSDSSNVELLIRAIQPEIVIHLAAMLGSRGPCDWQKKMLDINLGATLTILNAISEYDSHILFPSTGLIYGDQQAPFSEDMSLYPADFYALTKKMCEDAVRFYEHRHPVKATIFRPSVIYGPGQNNGMFIPSIIRNMLRKEIFPMTPGEQKRDFVYVEDVAEAFFAAIKTGQTGIFNIASGKSLRMIDAAKLIQDFCGHAGLIKDGALQYRKNECWNYSLSIEKAKKYLNWSPEYSFEKGIEKVVAYETAQA